MEFFKWDKLLLLFFFLGVIKMILVDKVSTFELLVTLLLLHIFLLLRAMATIKHTHHIEFDIDSLEKKE